MGWLHGLTIDRCSGGGGCTGSQGGVVVKATLARAHAGSGLLSNGGWSRRLLSSGGWLHRFTGWSHCPVGGGRTGSLGGVALKGTLAHAG